MIQYQILQLNILRVLRQKARRITNKILGAKVFRIKKQLDKHSNRTSKRNCSDSVMLGNFMASLYSEVEKTVLRAAFELQS